jgi:hypothetical protein
MWSDRIGISIAKSETGQFMVATMNPFMTETRGFFMKECAHAEFTAQFLVCEQTDRNQRPPNHNHYGR